MLIRDQLQRLRDAHLAIFTREMVAVFRTVPELPVVWCVVQCEPRPFMLVKSCSTSEESMA